MNIILCIGRLRFFITLVSKKETRLASSLGFECFVKSALETPKSDVQIYFPVVK